MDIDPLLNARPPLTLTTDLLWEALVDIGPSEEIGRGPHGQRVIIPILGGQFRGGPGQSDLHGQIEPGGADRQLIRDDGGKELDALYEMRIADGTLLSLRNRVITDATATPPYALSRIEVTAPQGRWDWLNRRLILGTLQVAMPERRAVIIRAFLAATGPAIAPGS